MIQVPLTLGIRYVRGKKRNRFGAVVSLFSLVGMALGVAALIIVLSVMNGFNREIQDRFQRVTPHVMLMPKETLAENDLNAFLLSNEFVNAYAPQLESYGLLARSSIQIPSVIRGIDPETDSQVIPLAETLLYGSLDDLQKNEFGIVLGRFMAQQLFVKAGDEIDLVLPQVQVTPAGVYPRKKRFRIVAIFDSGSQLDSELAYIHIQDASRLFRQSDLETGYRIRLNSERELPEFISSFAEIGETDNWHLQTWSTDYESLFRAMQMEKITVGLLLLIIILVAAFNIVSGLVMMVSDKRADMAVLRTLGADTAMVMRVFVVQGLFLGGCGILIGALVGTLLAFNLSEVVFFFERLFDSQVFDPNVFYVSFLPSHWMLSDFLWVIGLAFILNLLATLIPAWQASRIAPTEALIYKQ